MSRSFLFACAALLVTPIAPAMAYPHDDNVRAEVVHYGDLDLNYQPDANRMVHRIHRAASHVCSPESSVSDLGAFRECRRDSERRAVADTDAPLVSAQYYGRAPHVVIEDDGYVADGDYWDKDGK